EAHYNLGNILVQTGEIKEAVGHYRETLRLKPNFVLAQKNLERALLLAGKMEKFKNRPIKNLSD
ncbi:MAG TPA: tetratricopeptide repeat protein, partial [Methylococcales bacterium]|nr:tetratricopeptide repeat protein [Methylococcales bacterium]